MDSCSRRFWGLGAKLSPRAPGRLGQILHSPPRTTIFLDVRLDGGQPPPPSAEGTGDPRGQGSGGLGPGFGRGGGRREVLEGKEGSGTRPARRLGREGVSGPGTTHPGPGALLPSSSVHVLLRLPDPKSEAASCARESDMAGIPQPLCGSRRSARATSPLAAPAPPPHWLRPAPPPHWLAATQPHPPLGRRPRAAAIVVEA